MGALWDGVALSGNIEEAQRTCKKKREWNQRRHCRFHRHLPLHRPDWGCRDGRA